MRKFAFALTACALFNLAQPLAASTAKSQAQCAPLGKSKVALLALKNAGWQIDADAERNRFVLAQFI